MERRNAWLRLPLAATLLAGAAAPALASPDAIERARQLLSRPNPGQAAALGSGRLDAAILAFEDKDAFARSTVVERGKDRFGEFPAGADGQFRKPCGSRAQWSRMRNASNIDLHDSKRNEASTASRCEFS